MMGGMTQLLTYLRAAAIICRYHAMLREHLPWPPHMVPVDSYVAPQRPCTCMRGWPLYLPFCTIVPCAKVVLPARMQASSQLNECNGWGQETSPKCVPSGEKETSIASEAG